LIVITAGALGDGASLKKTNAGAELYPDRTFLAIDLLTTACFGCPTHTPGAPTELQPVSETWLACKAHAWRVVNWEFVGDQ
jgi:hypothetical protein